MKFQRTQKLQNCFPLFQPGEHSKSPSPAPSVSLATSNLGASRVVTHVHTNNPSDAPHVANGKTVTKGSYVLAPQDETHL